LPSELLAEGSSHIGAGGLVYGLVRYIFIVALGVCIMMRTDFATR